MKKYGLSIEEKRERLVDLETGEILTDNKQQLQWCIELLAHLDVPYTIQII